MTSPTHIEPDALRETISRRYTDALSDSSQAQASDSCCGGVCGPAPSSSSGVTRLAGYTPDQLAKLPADAVTNSFGCGNPVAFAGVGPGDVVLDLGSGAGIDLLLAAELVGPTGRVIGVDMTDAMIERARANIAAAGVTHVEVRKGLIEALPVEDASVDHVISNCVVNLSPEKSAVFAEIARVLKPGGQLSVSDIVTSGIPDALRESAAAISACVGGAISEEEYVAGLEAAGLVDARVVDRLVYDGDQLAGLVDSDFAGELEQAAGCCGIDIGAMARVAEGKVWSARFVARKP